MGGLQYLAITDLNLDKRNEWPARLIAQHRNTLLHLRLGTMNSVARAYAENILTRYDPSRWYMLPTSFRPAKMKGSRAVGPETKPVLSLRTLSLYGLSAEKVLRGAFGFEIDFKSLTSLRLASCCTVESAFALLMGKNGSPNASSSAIKLSSFFIRHEGRGHSLARHVKAFLLSFTGLKHLTLLLEWGESGRAMNKAPILDMHGKSLQTLVWDERTGPRKALGASSSVCSSNNLRLVLDKCPNLTTLGLPVNWEPHGSNAIHPVVSRQCDILPASGS